MSEEEVKDVSDKSLDAEMDESIRATLKEITSRNEESPVAEATEPVVEVKSDRARDETGKFTKVKESAAPAEKPDKAPPLGAHEQAAADPETLQGAVPAPVIDLNRAPSSWKPAAKAAWNALPEPVRAEIYRREGDFHNGFKGIKENADFGQAIKGVVEPYRMLIEAEGGTPEKAISDTLRTAALFRVGTAQQKLDAIFAIDKQFNAGLNAYVQSEFNRLYAQQTGQQPQQAAQPNYQDPRVDQLLAKMQEREREQASQAERASNSAVETFIAAKNDKGEALYPFVDNVLEDMSQRVATLRRLNPAMEHMEALKQAYDAAVWAHPETRAVLMSQQQAVVNQPAETLRKVEQAKRASAVNVPKRGALPATEPPKSLEDTIRETGKALGMF